jgi:hypothetical protein
MSGEKLGYVYVMQGDRPNELKIGFTSGSIAQREQDLHTTGMVSPLKTVYYVGVENPYEIEQEVHEKLQENRIISNREFFDCHIEVAIDAIKTAVAIRGKRILSEHRENLPYITEAVYDISVWPTAVRTLVKVKVDSVFWYRDRLKSKALNLQESSPSISETDVNLTFNWQCDAGELLESTPGVYLPEEEIRYRCGAISSELTNKYFKDFEDYVNNQRPKNILNPILYADIFFKFELFQKCTSKIVDKISNQIQDSEPIVELRHSIESFSLKVAELEDFFYYLPDDIYSNFKSAELYFNKFLELNFSERIPELEEEFNIFKNEIEAYFRSGSALWLIIRSNFRSEGIDIVNINGFTKYAIDNVRKCLLEDWSIDIERRIYLIEKMYEPTLDSLSLAVDRQAKSTVIAKIAVPIPTLPKVEVPTEKADVSKLALIKRDKEIIDMLEISGDDWRISDNNGTLFNKLTKEVLTARSGLGYSVSGEYFILHNKAQARKIKRLNVAQEVYKG